MKVYVHFDGETSGRPSHELKAKLPKKWAEKPVSNIMEMFVDAYNGKFKDASPLDIKGYDLADKTGLVIAGDAIIGVAIQDYQDIYITECKKEASEQEIDPSLLMCRNPGCSQRYREKENHAEACRHHAKTAVFWDGGKWWACCPHDKKYEWEDFVAIPGCVVGPHSNIAPEKPAAEPVTNQPIRQSCMPSAGSITPSPEAVAEEALPLPPRIPEDMEELSDVQPDGAATCCNAGCMQPYNIMDNHECACTYHSGPPVFHDGKKGYDCCNVHVYDFDDFLAIPGCTTGPHAPKTKLVKKRV